MGRRRESQQDRVTLRRPKQESEKNAVGFCYVLYVVYIVTVLPLIGLRLTQAENSLRLLSQSRAVYLYKQLSQVELSVSD